VCVCVCVCVCLSVFVSLGAYHPGLNWVYPTSYNDKQSLYNEKQPEVSPDSRNIPLLYKIAIAVIAGDVKGPL